MRTQESRPEKGRKNKDCIEQEERCLKQRRDKQIKEINESGFME
jgi:hypothetical protein